MGKYSGSIVCVLSFFVGMLFTAFVKNPPSGSTEWASWVQAIGSILAVIAAILVGIFQNEATVKREAKTSIEAMERALALFDETAGSAIRIKRHLVDAQQTLSEEPLLAVLLNRFTTSHNTFHLFPLFTLPSDVFVEGFLRAREIFLIEAGYFQDISSPTPLNGNKAKHLIDAYEALTSIRSSLLDSIRSAKTSAGINIKVPCKPKRASRFPIRIF